MKPKNDHRHSKSFVTLLAVYMAVCLAIMLICTTVLNSFVTQNNTVQVNNILSLMAEKVNTSFEMMTNYVIQLSDLVTDAENLDYDTAYKHLKSTTGNMPYSSVGLISADGTVYATVGEKMDIDRQGFKEKIKRLHELYISEPYRSSVTGSNMITMFAPVSKTSEYKGCIFVTYRLETIQSLAYSKVLSDNTTFFLMNPSSGNFVNCSTVDGNPPGTWNNVRLIKKDILAYRGYNLDDWLKSMESGSDNNIINFEQNHVRYTQAYINIVGMQGWSIVIRIPLTQLSLAMQYYTRGVSIVAGILVAATLLFAFVLYLSEKRRSKALKDLSDIDPLTKAVNRRAFEEYITEFLKKNKQATRCTYIFFDIDYFKNINDTYGHEAGDEVLFSTSETLRHSFGDSAIVARVGGDEFNIFVHEPLTEAQVDNIMANIRRTLSNLKIENGTSIPITFSAGLAVYPEDAKDMKSLSETADKALYHVKDAGRKNHFWFKDITEKS